MAATHPNMPTRSITNDDEVIPDEDSSEVTKLFLERLQAWKHACGYLEDYVEATEKAQSHHTKEYEKALKTVSNPLKEGHHFDQSLGGVAGMFDNIRSNTQGLANSHTETAKTLKGTVLPILERLHQEIKSKSKELNKGAGKGAKAVDKARNSTQKHVELLGQHTASFESSGGKVSALEDPYVLQRGVHHRLHKQIIEENSNRQDMIAVQSSFSTFEAHVVQTFQDAINSFNQTMSRQADQTRALYADMNANTSAIKPDFEWNGFVQRNNDQLIDPRAPERTFEGVVFPNQNHKSTQPMIAGSLERKGKIMKRYETAYYVVTPSKYLHEFKTDDDFAKDPQPENSLYLPDCTIGALDGTKFQVKGKDASKGGLGNKFSMSHDFAFKAHTPADAQKWWEVIKSVAGLSTDEAPDSVEGSPVSRTPSATFPESDTTGTAVAPTTAEAAPATAAATHAPADSSTERAAAGPTEGVAAADKA